MSTREDLSAAFAGESQANRKYLAYAHRAEMEGLPQIAKLFRAVAHAETVHAHAHLRAAGGVKATAENLQAAIDGEAYEFHQMYPPFVQQAQANGNQAAAASFANALAVEQIHHQLYTRALETLRGGKDLPPLPMFVCRVCGNTVYGQPPETCPICRAASRSFAEVI